MGLQRVTAPAEEPVGVEELRAYLRLDATDENATLEHLLAAARAHVEETTRRQLVTATWKLTADRVPRACDDPSGIAGRPALRLPLNPVPSVVHVKYADAASGTLTAWADWQLDAAEEPARILPAFGAVWPTPRHVPGALEVQFTAGYGTAAAVPAGLKQAILCLAAHWYRTREPIITGTILAQVPLSVESLLLQFHYAGDRAGLLVGLGPE